jgi:hypothetical protein
MSLASLLLPCLQRETMNEFKSFGATGVLADSSYHCRSSLELGSMRNRRVDTCGDAERGRCRHLRARGKSGQAVEEGNGDGRAVSAGFSGRRGQGCSVEAIC